MKKSILLIVSSDGPSARVPGYFFKAVKTATCSAWQVDVKELGFGALGEGTWRKHELVGGLEHFLFSHIYIYIGNNHPNWLIFFRGVQTTNQWILNTLIMPFHHDNHKEIYHKKNGLGVWVCLKMGSHPPNDIFLWGTLWLTWVGKTYAMELLHLFQWDNIPLPWINFVKTSQCHWNDGLDVGDYPNWAELFKSVNYDEHLSRFVYPNIISLSSKYHHVLLNRVIRLGWWFVISTFPISYLGLVRTGVLGCILSYHKLSHHKSFVHPIKSQQHLGWISIFLWFSYGFPRLFLGFLDVFGPHRGVPLQELRDV